MRLFRPVWNNNYDVRCKKCHEKVIYQWRNCPYCNSKQFVRIKYFNDIDFSWPFDFEWPRFFLTDRCFNYSIFLLWYLLLFYLWISKSFYKIWDPVAGAIGKVLTIILFIGGPILICWILVYFADIILFYFLKPFVHIFGEKVSIVSIATNSNYLLEFRLSAIKRLTDQVILANIAKNDVGSVTRVEAVNNLTDQSVLADIAKNDENLNVRIAAEERLTDFIGGGVSNIDSSGELLRYSQVRLAAAEKLDN